MEDFVSRVLKQEPFYGAILMHPTLSTWPTLHLTAIKDWQNFINCQLWFPNTKNINGLGVFFLAQLSSVWSFGPRGSPPKGHVSQVSQKASHLDRFKKKNGNVLN